MPDRSPHDPPDREALIALLDRHTAGREGGTETILPGVSLVRFSAPRPLCHITCTRSVYFVGQGSKAAHHGDRQFTYDPDHYVVTSVPMPMTTEVREASAARPYLAVGIELSLEVVREVLQRGRQLFRDLPPPQPQQGLAVSEVSAELRAVVVRLLALLDRPAEVPVLAPLFLQELVWRVVTGSQGDFLRAIALGHGRAHAISEILLGIQQDCTRDWAIPELAQRAGMSETLFYEAFRTVTGRSPLQYIKHLRLLEAQRQLALGGGVSEVAYRVGYGSPSQFSREFKRFFGAPPSALALPVQAR